MKFRKLVLFVMLGAFACMLCACGKGNETKVTPTPTTEAKPTIPVTDPVATPTDEPAATPTNEPAATPTGEPVATPTAAVSGVKLPNGKSVTIDNLPRVDGALALEPFYDAIFAELLGLPVEDAKLFLPCNNTPGAYKNLTEGKCDMIFCALPSDEQVETAKKAGVEFEYHTVLSGGFVFFVSRENPVNSVTQQQLKDIVSGKIKNWKEVGGDDEPIVLFQRNEGSGSQTGLYRYVLPKDQVMEPILEHRVDDMAGAIDRVVDYDNGKGAISFSYYYYVANMHGSDQIKLLGIDGVIPSDETISKGQYPFLNFSQIVTRKDLPQDSIVRDIIAWVQGENGARIARENGYVPNEVK
ncbi:MAG: substrate-binding domain-containing protein [Lachnospiraceae bacterium]|nr:substrate-binding domain-containing protein [Lachnospiraceae bacterium]